MNWKFVRIEEVCEILGGTTPKTNHPEYWDGEVVWLSPIDLPEIGTITNIYDSKRKITNLGLKSSSLKLLPLNSVVFSSRASIGKIGLTKVPLVTNQGFTNFVPSKRIDSNYLAYVLKSKIPDILKLANSTTFLEVSKSNIRNLEIPLPPLSTQRRIAEILDTADTLRRKDQALLLKYDELAQAIFIDMFGDPVRNEKGVPLNEIVKINPTKSEIEIPNDTEVTFVPMANVGEDGSFNNLMTKQFEEVKTGFTYFKEDDVLFAKITPCMENGKGAIAKGLVNGIGFGSTEFHVLRPNNSLSSDFIFHLLHLKNVRKYAEMCMSGSAGQKRVPTDFFGKIKISIPEELQQRKFITAIDNIKNQRQNISLNIEKSESLFQTLLQKSFSGELIA